MKKKYFATKDLLYIIYVSFMLGALLASIENGNWLIGFISFSFLFFLSLAILTISSRLAIGAEWNEPSGESRRSAQTLGLIIALAFFLRLAVGMALHFVDAFNQKYGSDQYGGLLAFNTAVYRYFSPDAHRPLILILLSAFFAALGVPFLWKATSQVFGEKVAWASTWIFALYPDSILLGASAMREPYLLTFSAFAFLGFVHRFYRVEENASVSIRGDVLSLLKDRTGWIWIALGLLGMLLVSPAIALVTIIVFAGWMFFNNEGREVSWRGIAGIAIVFLFSLLFLSSSLNRSGEFVATSPLHVINDWFQSAVKWDAYQLERDSGWVQKIFDEGPRWIRLPFVAVYGIFQPVLPATIIYPTKLIWKLIGILRALSWYVILPMLILSFVAAAGQESRKMRNLILWLSLLIWIWILLAALRGGADLFDNPRYRKWFSCCFSCSGMLAVIFIGEGNYHLPQWLH